MQMPTTRYTSIFLRPKSFMDQLSNSNQYYETTDWATDSRICSRPTYISKMDGYHLRYAPISSK